MNCIFVLEENGLQEFFPVASGTIKIGRESDNDIQILDESVSRHHAIVYNMANTCEVEDINSSNGVTVNGIKINRALLKHGDELKLGKCVMRFELVRYEVGEDFTSASRDYSSRSHASTVKVKLPPELRKAKEEKPTTTLSPFRLKKKGDIETE